MSKIISFNTPQEFLNATESLLEQKELENNIILGICNSFPDKSKPQENCFFINSVENAQIHATSIKTMSRAIVAGTSENIEHVKILAEYYNTNNIDLSGVVGDAFYARAFSKFYHKKTGGERTLIAHELRSVNKLPIAAGELQMATKNDIEQITRWTMQFQADAKGFLRQSFDELFIITKGRIESENLFKWMFNDEMVSIAAIVRKTKTIGIVGLVYTPAEFRGSGYATSSVLKLSEYILENGFKKCGLFTDKSNPTSNHIYRKIGYEPLTEFADIQFL